jgi:hypothetical protein
MLFSVVILLVFQNVYAQQYDMLQPYKDNLRNDHYKTAYNYTGDMIYLIGIFNVQNLTSISIPSGEPIGYQYTMHSPSWFVNDIHWWANSEISDNDFGLAIQYLYSNDLLYFS